VKQQHWPQLPIWAVLTSSRCWLGCGILAVPAHNQEWQPVLFKFTNTLDESRQTVCKVL
jgi:hypothetical protein